MKSTKLKSGVKLKNGVKLKKIASLQERRTRAKKVPQNVIARRNQYLA